MEPHHSFCWLLLASDSVAVDNLHLLVVVIVALLVIIVILLIALYLQHQYYHRRLSSMRPEPKQIATLGSEPVSSCPSCPDAKRQDMILRLEKLMHEDHLYREKLLTRERVAEILETNRTYLGQVINEVYQKTFTQYINDLRIDEAQQILSNPSCKRPIRLVGLDLGFNSVTTFNTQFQNRTGVSPAQFRQNSVLEKYETEQNILNTDED